MHASSPRKTPRKEGQGEVRIPDFCRLAAFKIEVIEVAQPTEQHEAPLATCIL